MTSTIHRPCTITLGKSFAEEALLRRIRGEYREMPGMRLTIDQAMRLFMLDRRTCAGVLDSLVHAQYLEQDRSGRYGKAHGGY
ncbi:MAG TPA: hypothetical protein VF491_04145 [Vicinamibacterales bacterium]|jgi:hypothetical protein